MGAFAYVWPVDGTVNLCLKQDNEVASTVPVAEPLNTGNREYRIKCTNQRSGNASSGVDTGSTGLRRHLREASDRPGRVTRLPSDGQVAGDPVCSLSVEGVNGMGEMSGKDKARIWCAAMGAAAPTILAVSYLIRTLVVR